jgi:hypothetical protein
MLQKYEKPRENGNLLPVFREHFKTTSKIVKDKSNRVGLHAKIAESLPVFCKDSTTSRRSQIFLSVAALEYLGKVRDTDKSGGAKRIYSRFVEAKNRKRNEGTNDSSMIGAVLPGCGSVKIQRASVEDALCIKRNRIFRLFSESGPADDSFRPCDPKTFVSPNALHLFLLGEKVFHLVVGDDALFEDVCTGFVGFHHFDTFGELFARTGFQRCDYFLCHIALKLFDFTMNGHLLQERIVLLALQTVGGVFLVLGRDVAGHSRNTASFLFRAFENHLHSVAFLCHLSLEF